MYAASSEARNLMAPATSCSVPALPMGIKASMASFAFSSRAAVISVSRYPGATALTVIPLVAISLATDLVSPIMPALDAA